MDLVVYSILRKYVDDTLSGAGALKGAACTIHSIEDNDDSSTVTFKWVDNAGNESFSTMTVENGISVTNVKIDSDNKLTCTLSNGTKLNCGTVQVTEDPNKINYSNIDAPQANTVKKALDQLFEEGGGILEEEITPNVTIGSVKSSYPVGTPLEEILRDILTEKIPPVVTLNLNPSTTLYDEVSDSINSLTINASITKKTNDIAKVEYYVNNSLVKTTTTSVAGGGTFPYIYNSVIDDDTTIKVVVTDTEGLSNSATKTINFVGKSYYGLVDAETGEPTEALVKTLSTNLKNTKKFVYSNITTDWAKICYAYPAEFGKLTSIMDKVNNFNYTASFQLTTKTIDGISYYIYTLIDPTGADNVELTFE